MILPTIVKMPYLTTWTYRFCSSISALCARGKEVYCGVEQKPQTRFMRHYSEANGQFLLAITSIWTQALQRRYRLYSYTIKKFPLCWRCFWFIHTTNSSRLYHVVTIGTMRWQQRCNNRYHITVEAVVSSEYMEAEVSSVAHYREKR